MAVEIVKLQSGVNAVMVEDRIGNSQWPVLYGDNTVGWDFPERVSDGDKVRARDLLRQVRGDSIWIAERGLEDAGAGFAVLWTTEPYETWAPYTQVGRLFRSLQREYGRCEGSIYNDDDERVGWTFVKRVPFTDSHLTYRQRVNVVVCEPPMAGNACAERVIGK